MKVYVVLTEDRHTDVDVDIFVDKGKAIDFARKHAKEYCRFEEDYEERFFEDELNGWIAVFDYSCESDRLTVIEREIILDIK